MSRAIPTDAASPSEAEGVLQAVRAFGKDDAGVVSVLLLALGIHLKERFKTEAIPRFVAQTPQALQKMLDAIEVED